MMIEKVNTFFFKFRYEILALLLTAVLFGGTLVPIALFEQFIMPSCFILLSVNAIIIVRDEKKIMKYTFYVFVFLTLGVFFIRVLNHEQRVLQTIPLFVFILFFAVLTYEVFRQMILEKEITRNIIIAAFDCYLLLGLMGAMLFSLITAYDPNAFANVEGSAYIFDKMLYFSFITLTSIGYGDISPLSPIAEKMTALFGLVAHFYSVVIVGVIVGKYVSARS